MGVSAGGAYFPIYSFNISYSQSGYYTGGSSNFALDKTNLQNRFSKFDESSKTLYWYNTYNDSEQINSKDLTYYWYTLV